MQRLLLRLLGRRPSLHWKGCQAINKSNWGSEWEQAQKGSRTEPGGKSQSWGHAPSAGFSEGRLTLELPGSMSYSPTPIPSTCRSALGPHICMEKLSDWLRCLLSQGDQEAVREAPDSTLRWWHYTESMKASAELLSSNIPLEGSL